MYKIIDEQTVKNLETGEFFDPNTPYHTAAVYKDWLAEGNTPDPADTPGIEELRASKIKGINDEASKVAATLTSGYPEFEMQTWPDQKAEALAWDADNTAATPVIDSMASERGIDRELYLQKTLAKVQYFTVASSYLVGTRQKYVDQINAATSQAEIEAIVPKFTLPS